MAEKRTSNNVIGPLYRYMKERPDMVVHLSDMRADLDLNPTSIDSAINRMVANPEYRVFRGPVKGTYMYKTAVKADAVSANPEVIASKSAVAPKVAAIPSKLPIDTQCDMSRETYEFVGHLNDVTDILRDTRARLYVAMPLDQYISGKPGK